MGALIRRELREVNLAKDYKNPTKAFLSIYGILGIGIPGLLWLLGPGLVGIFDIESFNVSVSVAGMVLTWQTVHASLLREDANRQKTFLQTLPVKKEHIIHAKYTSVLLFCLGTITWMVIVIFLNLFINGIQMDESWLLLGYFVSLIIFIAATSLLTYFRVGTRRLTMTSVLISIFIWGGVLALSGLFMNRIGQEPGILFFIGFMIVSFAIYLICWWLSVRRVNKKGFPIDEGHKTKRIEDIET